MTGFLVAATAFVICAAILGVHFPAFDCPRCRGHTGRIPSAAPPSDSASAHSDCAAATSALCGRDRGFLLLLSGANVPLDRLPQWSRRSARSCPDSRHRGGHERRGRSPLADVGGLLGKEALIGLVLLVVGLAMLRFFEYEGRRTASLETF